MPSSVTFVPQNLQEIKSSKELVLILRDAVELLAKYHEAGVVHGCINTANIMKASAEQSRYGLNTKGLLLDLDDSVHYQEPKGVEEDATHSAAKNENAGHT